MNKKNPTDLHRALAARPSATAAWDGLTPIAQRDFLRWIETAKQAETRARRVERTCAMLAAGKRRPCCYAVVPMDVYKALATHPKAKARWGRMTPDERRDLVDRIDATEQKEERKTRIANLVRRLL